MTLISSALQRQRCSSLLLLFVISTFAAVGVAQRAITDATKAPNVDGCSRRSIVLTSSRDPEGINLQPSDLRIKVSDANPSVLYLERENIAPRVIVVLDMSGSMWSSFGPKWSNALMAANFVLDAVPADSQVALVTFSEQIHAAPFGRRDDVRRALIALAKEKPKGRTALFTAIEQALPLFGEPRFGDSLYIVSDGGDDYGPDTPRQAADALIQRGTRAFAFLVQDPQGDRSTPKEREGLPQLADLVTQTGGVLLTAAAPARWMESKDGVEALNMLRRQLQTPYKLEIQLADPPKKFSRLQIKSVDSRVQLAYPARIPPCSPLSAATHP